MRGERRGGWWAWELSKAVVVLVVGRHGGGSGRYLAFGCMSGGSGGSFGSKRADGIENVASMWLLAGKARYSDSSVGEIASQAVDGLGGQWP